MAPAIAAKTRIALLPIAAAKGFDSLRNSWTRVHQQRVRAQLARIDACRIGKERDDEKGDGQRQQSVEKHARENRGQARADSAREAHREVIQHPATFGSGLVGGPPEMVRPESPFRDSGRTGAGGLG